MRLDEGHIATERRWTQKMTVREFLNRFHYSTQELVQQLSSFASYMADILDADVGYHPNKGKKLYRWGYLEWCLARLGLTAAEREEFRREEAA